MRRAPRQAHAVVTSHAARVEDVDRDLALLRWLSIRPERDDAARREAATRGTRSSRAAVSGHRDAGPVRCPEGSQGRESHRSRCPRGGPRDLVGPPSRGLRCDAYWARIVDAPPTPRAALKHFGEGAGERIEDHLKFLECRVIKRGGDAELNSACSRKCCTARSSECTW